MIAQGRLVLVGPGSSTEWLIPRDGAFDEVRSIDGAWLEHAVAGTPVADTVTYQHGLDETLATVERDGSAAVLIRPVSLAEIERTAREGQLMPPKSTFFTPKLRTGFVVRDLRD